MNLMGEHEQRPDMMQVAPKVVALMRELSKLPVETGLEPRLVELIKVRASQINGCAFCLDMHAHDARKLGISDTALLLLSAWREAPYFSEAERAALELTEAVTLISEHGVPDALYEKVSRHFNAEQYLGLLTAINVINGWNRFMIATGKMAPAR